MPTVFSKVILGTAGFPPVKSLVTKSKVFRPMVSRFVAGESLADAMAAAEALAERGLFSSLDLLGENVANEEEAAHETEAYRQIIEAISKSPHRDKINISIKLTAIGLDQGETVCERNYRTLLEFAKPHGIFIRADMESSAYTERTILMIERVWGDYPNTGTVLQSYLYRTPQDVERMVALGARVRIVKGAYLEPASVAYQEKSKVDEAYVEGAKRLLKEGHYPAIASQDEDIINALKAFVVEQGISPDRFEWQMLYGIRRDLQDQLRLEGYNVRVYIPFGDAWYPYFTRRLAERPANLLFILKNAMKRG